MIWTMVRKELLENVFSLRFGVSAIICIGLSAVASYNLVANYEEAIATYSANVSASKEALENMTRVEQIHNIGLSVHRRPEILHVFSQGIDAAIVRSVVIGTSSSMRTDKGLLDGNPTSQMLGTVDSTYIVIVVLSIIALLFSYNALSGERERGTLRLMMANSVSRHSILLGKYLGGFLTLLFPFMLFFLITPLFIIRSPDFAFNGEDWIRVLGFGVISLLYLAIFLFLGMLISVKVSSSFESILILLFIWAVLVWGIPRLGAFAIGHTTHLKSFEQLDREIASWTWKRGKEIAGEMGVDIMDNTPGKYPKELIEEVTRRLREFQQVEIKKYEETAAQEYFAEIDRRMDRFRWVMRLSPASSYFFATSALARAGWEDEQQFVQAVRRYHETIRAFAQRKKEERNKILQAHGGDRKSVENFDFRTGMPIFSYSQRTLREMFSTIWPDVYTLLLWNVILFMASYLVFLRREVI